ADGLAFLARMCLASSGKTADKLEKPCLRPTVPILGPVLAGRHGTGRADQFVGFLDTACQRQRKAAQTRQEGDEIAPRVEWCNGSGHQGDRPSLMFWAKQPEVMY